MPESLANSSGAEAALTECARGFPQEAALKAPENIMAVHFVRGLLESGPQSFKSYELPEGAWQAHKLGWVTLEDLEDQKCTIMAEFPSLFHQSRLSYLLNGSQEFPATVEGMDLAKFIIKVISSFSADDSKPHHPLSGDILDP